MVAISFYRGNLHRVPDRPRQWPMPTQSISLRDFKLLTRRRSKALSLLRTVPNPSDHPKQDSHPVIEDGPADIKPQPQQQEEQQQIHAQDSQPQPSITPNIVDNYDNATQPQHLANTPGTMEGTRAGVAPLDSGSSPPPKPALPNGGNEQEDCGGSGSKDSQGKEAAVDSGKAEMEVANGLDVPSDKEKRKKELEKKLQILNERKHQLVQALKQILNAEEEMTRRNSIQISGGRAAVPLQAEAQAVPKMSLEANLGDDLEGESEDASNHNTHARHLQQTQCTSPSTASPLRRPVYGSLQHNTAAMLMAAARGLLEPVLEKECLEIGTIDLVGSGPDRLDSIFGYGIMSNNSSGKMVPYPSRGSLVAAGHTQTTSNVLTGVTASPSRFAPSGHQGHAASLPPVSVSGSHFIASSPSPAASGGTSAFRDGRLTSPTWN